ncbi:hypothetical protein E1B28_011301 [Marasmius oreades]|uniref:Wax synthase domain-containing protein n=1 Tax=Marasmius oreades TaxID=181124 RepID=A0A9P7RTV0_9AGAR|nr:uncharacterized protein E1B28_011301 [Marasmius oreades]KAG7089639.1 hypothetical protein E1B28_011301 [Marasmius oreades]
MSVPSWFAEVVSPFFDEPYHRPTPANLESLIQLLLPPVVGYFLAALIACLPTSTRLIRLLLVLPIVLLACRAAAQLDFAHPFHDDRMIYLNQALLLAMTAISMRVMTWGLVGAPYRKTFEVSGTKHTRTWKLMIDAVDLAIGSREIGWNHTKGLYIPAQARPTSNERVFILYTLTSLITHLLVFDSVHYHLQSFTSFNLACPQGSGIYNHELPPLQRYALSSYITFLAGIVVYGAMQVAYGMMTIVCITLFQQNPSQWPPLFDPPWKATSIRNFWAKHWHQAFRGPFISLGAVPGSYLFGRAGGVIGAFFVSGVLHYLALWGMGRGSDWRAIGFFLAMALGIILEDLWKRASGRRVAGVFGWIWTCVWTVGWGNILVDAWARKGLIATKLYPEGYRPAERIFGPLANASC